VSAQLIDARNDTHVWAEKYDRDLADVFAIQSEIAEKIADQLQAKLSPTEKSAMNERPTSDMAAYDLYLRAKGLIYDSDVIPSRGREDLFNAVQLLEQALARDPAFLLAHCQLAYAHDDIYLFNYESLRPNALDAGRLTPPNLPGDKKVLRQDARAAEKARNRSTTCF